jgi:hypothetical protein
VDRARTATPGRPPAARRPRWAADHARPLLIAVATVACGAVLLLAYLGKQQCAGPLFDAFGRSLPDWTLRANRDLCYSDIQYLWIGRDINQHVFPYVHGGLAFGSRLDGGSLEYPVLTGLFIWLAAIGAHTDAAFLAHNALMLAPFGLLTAALLFALAGRRACWFVGAPALVLYAFLSWDLIPVALVTIGLAVLLAGPSRWSRRRRAIVAGIAFGVGGAAKFYPLMFAAPVIAWLLLPEPEGPAGERRPDVRGAALVAAATVGSFALINAPFAIAGFRGWWASFQFQWSRPLDESTNSIWFWAIRPPSDDAAAQHALALVSTGATAAGMAAVLTAGFLVARRRRAAYPWLPVAAALLCAYLLLNKVHSPQYVLWLLPFFVLLRIRAGWILAYFAADVCLGVGFFHLQYLLNEHLPSGIRDSWAAQAVVVGVWGRAGLLVGLVVAFLAAAPARARWTAAGPLPAGAPQPRARMYQVVQ